MGKYNLEELYNQVAEAITTLDFERIWQGFKPLKFALYDDEKCYFDGGYVEKTVDFCANTAIEYQGVVIAIWHVQNELDLSVLTSKIVHEMFHAFQEKQGWKCFPNEKEAPFKYKYQEENLCIKYHESRLLLKLLDSFDNDTYKELLACRKYRSEKYPYEFSYESMGEAIEGTATYVEWQTLKQLDKKQEKEFIDNLRDFLLNPECFFPIRITGYFTGPLMINAMVNAGDFYYGSENRPVIIKIIKDAEPGASACKGNPADNDKVAVALSAYVAETKGIIETAVKNNDVVLEGPLELVSVNIGDARYFDGYLTSRAFLMYRENGEKKAIHDSYVVKMKDENTIEKVYRWIIH